MVRHFRVPGILHVRLEEAGVRVPAVLRRAGLPHDLFAQTRILLNTTQFFALWQAIVEVAEDPAIGLILATESRKERFHPMGIAALATDSFGAAVEHMARYKKLCAPEEIVHRFEGPEDSAGKQWAIQFRWLLALDAEPQALVDYCFAWILTIARHGTGAPVYPVRIELLKTRPDLQSLERHFNCPVLCGAPRNAIVFDAQAAALPFVTRNAELLDMLAPQLDQELSQYAGDEQSFLELVRGAIHQRLTGRRPNVEDIARDLHMSSRTLQRRLQEAGSSFLRILDEARHQMARYYLSNSVLELTEAAYLLGYEDTSSFARAFRTWEGMAPKNWRESRRIAAVA